MSDSFILLKKGKRSMVTSKRTMTLQELRLWLDGGKGHAISRQHVQKLIRRFDIPVEHGKRGMWIVTYRNALLLRKRWRSDVRGRIGAPCRTEVK